MIDPRQAPYKSRYQWGQRVVALEDLYNDGGYPDHPADALLVAEGEAGEIVQIGMHQDTQTPVYLVEFKAGVIGCLEEEIQPLEAAA